MLGRIAAKIAFALAGPILFGIGMYFLSSALVVALTATLGPAGGYAVAGAILALPALLWAVITLARPAPQMPVRRAELVKAMFCALTREKTWHILARLGSVIANELLGRE